MSEAEHLAQGGEFKAALAKYDSAFALVPWIGSEYFDPAIVALRAGQQARAIELLLVGAEHGLDPMNWSDSLFQSFMKSGKAERYLRERPLRDALYRTTYDTAFIAEVHRMVEQDQAVRRKEVDPTIMVLQDSLHFERMLAISAEHGYPTWRRLGAEEGNWWLLVWHHRDASEYPHSRQWQQMLPFINQAISSGDLNPAYLCMFDDYVDEKAGRPMRYGALLSYLQNMPERLYLVDRDTLDRNRASVGWGPISWSAAEVGIDLTTIRFAEP